MFKINEYIIIDTDPIPESYTHIIFNIIYKKIKLQFNIEIGFESSNFASEVIRSKERMCSFHKYYILKHFKAFICIAVSSFRTGDFQWLDKYSGSGIVQTHFNLEESEMNDQVYSM